MKNYLLIGAIFFLSVTAPAQSSVKWQASLEPQKVFIENKSQFNDRNKLYGSEILFGTDESPVMIYFTKNGLSYCFTKTKLIVETEEERVKEKRRMPEREEEEHQAVITTDEVHLQWENSNPAVQVIPMELSSAYYNYENISNVKAYKKLLYKNLYPNIDAEYIYHPHEGLKYSLILHPGADISEVKMKYSGTNRVSVGDEGSVHIATKFGDIIDRAPVTTYEYADNATISSHFVKEGKTIAFALGDYDHSQRVIVDPWTTTPPLPNSNSAFYIKSDSSGNAYIYGGDSPFRLHKYNSAGVLQWTYNTPWNSGSRWFGALAADKAGNCYLTNGDGATLAKIDPSGSFTWSHASGNTFSDLIEFWALDFNCDETELYIGGMSAIPFAFDFRGTIFKMNLTNGNIISRISVVHPALSISNEVRSLCSTPDGNIHYLSLDTVGSITSSLAINYGRRSTYTFPYYLPYSNTGGGQGQNNLRASSQFLYTTDGATLHKRDIVTGAILGTAAVPGGSANNNSGIAIDSCGNVYVGAQQRVAKFDGNLNFIISSATPAPVYDVSIGLNGDILACGQNFAVALAMSACAQLRATCFTPLAASTTQTNFGCNSTCNGTATANPQGGTAPFAFAWSVGNQTTQTATGLCAGAYTVTITDAASVTASASVTIIQTGSLNLTTTSVNTSCGNPNGSATVNPTTGTSPYVYLWNNGGNTQSITNVASGIYIVTVTDAGGCSGTASVMVNPSGNTPVSISANYTIICSGDSALICAPSGYQTYLWNTGQNGQCIYGKLAGNYYVTVTDQGNCTASSNRIALTIFPLPPVSISVNGDTLTAYNAITYQWYLNGQIIQGAFSNIYVANQTGDYTVAVTDTNGCLATSTKVTIITGINNLLNDEEIRVYPNPLSTGNWQITVGNKLIGSTIEIFNAAGQIVNSAPITHRQSQLKVEVAKGIYLLKVNSGGKNITIELVKF